MRVPQSPRLLFLLMVIYFGLISSISHIPGPEFPSIDIKATDKLAHVIIYFPMGFLLSLFLRANNAKMPLRTQLGIALLVLAILATVDEYHQSFVPGRDPSVLDGIADGIGGLLGLFCARYIVRKKTRDSTAGL